MVQNEANYAMYMNMQFNYSDHYNVGLGKWQFTSISNIASWLSGIQFPMAYSWTQKSSGYTYSNQQNEVDCN
jgi:hypothetical protein